MTQQEFQTRYEYNPSTDCIGEGGFGKVYKAYDTHLNKWVAIKVAEVKTGMEQVRLKKEVEIVSKLQTHPNIANYEACYTFSSFTGEYDFAVLQYYEEGNLQQLIDSGKLNQTQKEALLRQILEGIGFLHNQDIIHRDLKPQNILIAKRNDQYIPKITDFGISKKLDINKSSVFTNSLAGAGTMAYASPEQLLGKTIKKNTDLWSFGVIAFQLLTGKMPFNTGKETNTSEAGRLELFKQITSGAIPEQLRIISSVWQDLILKCLVVDSKNRLCDTNTCLALLKGNNLLKTKNQQSENENVNVTEAMNSITDTPKTTILEDSTVIQLHQSNLDNNKLNDKQQTLETKFNLKGNKKWKVYSSLFLIIITIILFYHFRLYYKKDTVRDIDGNFYHTVNIGTQTWMVENLRTSRLNDGTKIAFITKDKTWSFTSSPAYCYPNNENKFNNKDGFLYNYHAVETGKLAPKGWRVANDNDWETLREYSKTIEGNSGYLKAPNNKWGDSNEEAINKFGFSALPVSQRYSGKYKREVKHVKYIASYFSDTEQIRWWSSTTTTDNTIGLSYLLQFTLTGGINGVNDGLSVRCIKE